MRIHEIVREQARDQIGVTSLLNAIYRSNREYRQNGEDNSKAALMAQLAILRSHLIFPLTVYRALSVPPSEIDWTRVGCSWTWNRKTAVVGGVLGEEADARTILQTTVTEAQADIPATMWQFLTVYEEEQEVRLRPHTSIIITGIEVVDEADGHQNNPPMSLPIHANTGTPMWDDAGIDDGIRQAMRIR